jgi:hypothetical protein
MIDSVNLSDRDVEGPDRLRRGGSRVGSQAQRLRRMLPPLRRMLPARHRVLWECWRWGRAIWVYAFLMLPMYVSLMLFYFEPATKLFAGESWWATVDPADEGGDAGVMFFLITGAIGSAHSDLAKGCPDNNGSGSREAIENFIGAAPIWGRNILLFFVATQASAAPLNSNRTVQLAYFSGTFYLSDQRKPRRPVPSSRATTTPSTEPAHRSRIRSSRTCPTLYSRACSSDRHQRLVTHSGSTHRTPLVLTRGFGIHSQATRTPPVGPRSWGRWAWVDLAPPASAAGSSRRGRRRARREGSRSGR